jgi:hypothetical protein
MPVTIQMPDGQSFPLDAEIAGSDELLRDALRVAYPDAANAEFQRETKDGQAIVRVIKKAGTKGATAEIIAALARAMSHENPAVLMQERVATIRNGPEATANLILMRAEIEQAVREGLAELRVVTEALRSLTGAAAQAADIIPPGF